jgi:phospholipid/cholesterol/gamma-HCH transport system substrate-binding protein
LSGGPIAGGSGAGAGQASTRATASAAKAGASASKAATAAVAGSPPESELVRELAGMALGKSPAKVAGWSGLLLAPLFRGATVKLVARP